MTDEKTPLAEGEMPSRRRFLKRAVVALPVVATIPSGAALAQSSNMISYRPFSAANTTANTPTIGGDIVCINTQYATVHTDTSLIDLGTPPMLGDPPAVRMPADATYQRTVAPIGRPISAAEACEAAAGKWDVRLDGGTGSPTRSDSVPKGMVVSATAISSFMSLDDIGQI